MVMKGGKCLLIFLFAGIFMSCSDDGKRDDTILNIDKVTGKYWYCINWANTPNSYTTEDLVEAVKLESSGKLWTMDFSGRIDREVGTWFSGENEITLRYDNGTTEKWGVLHSGSNYLTVMVNKGERKYVTEPVYLQDLTGDAYLINEIKSSGVEPTRVGVSVKGKNTVNMSEASVIAAPDKVFKLAYRSRVKSWTDKGDIVASEFELPENTRDIVFYIKVSGHPLKFKDRIYAENLPQRSFRDFGLNAYNEGKSLRVEWNPYDWASVYYRVEVLKENADAANPYFVSQLYAGIESLSVDSNTKTETDVENRMGDLKNGDKYIVRLSAILLEPGIDYNHKYSNVNIQAISYVQRTLVWTEE